MDDQRPSPIALQYAAPEVFFQREYRTCNQNAILTAVVVSLFLAGGAWLGRQRLVRWGEAAVALTLLVPMTAWYWYMVLSRRTWMVRITSDGIEADRKVWAWQRVKRIGGMRVGEGIQIYATLRGTIIGPTLWTTPPLTDDEYDRLRVALEHYFSTRDIAVSVSRHVPPPD